MSEFQVSMVIFVVAFILMLLAARRDHVSLKQGNHTDMKSVIVSIGVLGTFVGIVIGLWDFDTSDITSSVPKLLEGLKLAFATSIAGMLISITLSFVQRSKIDGGDDEIAILSEISGKLSALNSLAEFNEQVSGLRVEFRDEMNKSRTSNLSILEKIFSEISSTNKKMDLFPTIDHINKFRNEIHEEQIEMKKFLQEQFVATNDSLKQAIDVLSRGATEQIIKALENVIKDFNNNLTEQFGDNFKELNSAVMNLLEWQKQHKEIIEKDGSLLIEVRNSLADSSSTIGKISERNKEVIGVYEQLKELIETYDSQLSSINRQLEKYSLMGAEAAKAFETLSGGFEKVQEGIGAQSETISNLTRELSLKLPESLGELENTLVGLTTEFGKDYKSFLDNYKNLVRG